MRRLKKTAAAILAAAMLSSIAPCAAAADNESVLKSIGHRVTNTVTLSGGTRSITLTVPYGYSGDTVDLSDGLSITYDTSRYKYVVASPSPSTVAVGGASATLTVTYNLATDGEGAPKGKTTYTVRVVRAQKVSPTFSGSVAISFDLDVSPKSVPIPFSSFAEKYAKNDGEDIGGISISGSNPQFGCLTVGGSQYQPGSYIGKNSDIAFVATSAGVVSYDVYAYAGADTTHPIGVVVLTITANSDEPPQITSPIATTVAKGSILTFSEAFFTSHCDMRGMALYSVEITPQPTTCGTWYLGSTPLQASVPQVVTASQLSSLTFSATSPGTATFTWRVSTKAGALWSDVGTGTITVESPSLTLSPYISPAPILKGATWTLSPSHFAYTPSSAALAYIKIVSAPPGADGYLYLTTALPQNDTYGYPAISANAPIAQGAVIPASHIPYLRLATKSASKSAEVSFQWTATADMKVPTATWAEAATYTVRFVSGGTISCSTDMNVPLALPSTEMSSQFSALTGQALSYVTFTLPDKNSGTLYYNYDPATKKGTPVAAATRYYTGKSPNLANVTFVPAADYTGAATITYNAYTEAGLYLTCTIVVSVSNSPGGTLTLQTDKNSPVQFDAAAFKSAFSAATGRELSYVRFSLPPSSTGALYYDYGHAGSYESAVSSGTSYYVRQPPYLSLVSFVPAQDFKGTATVYFTGYATDSRAYTGKAVITVLDSPAGIVSYSLAANTYVALSGDDFEDEFVSVTGSMLSYVTFTPPSSSAGTLYVDYSAKTQTGTKVSSSMKFYSGRSPDISGITFVPAKDFIGTVTVQYTAYSTSGTAYAGKLKFTVRESSQTIYYSTQSGRPIAMYAGDFESAFFVISGGKMLSHVTFDLPSASYGRLYYDYSSPSSYDSAVASGRKYYLISSPYLSRVSFVPADDFAGSFTLTYTGYATTGEAYPGKIRITVSRAASGSVHYTTNSSTPVTFNASDFISAHSSYGTLWYVTFTLPYSSYGTLYYSYSSPASYISPVYPSTAYYVSSYPSLSSVTFVPNESFSGVLAIGYTAYFTTGGSTAGTVLITVNSGDLDTIAYNTLQNTPVYFNSADFGEVFLEKTGSSLDYVTFTLPPESCGKLYLGYKSPSEYVSAVTSSARYYRSYSPLISDVAFVPKQGYTGSVSITYRGYAASGASYTGKVIVNVGGETPFADMTSNYAWASDAVSYLYRKGVVKGSGNMFYPSSDITRGDFTLMVARAFDLSGGTDNFADVPSGSYYYDAISAAKALGIVRGSGGHFYPQSSLSRQDAAVIILRALEAKGKHLAAGTSSDLNGFADVSQIADYAVLPMATLVRAGILTGSGGRLNPQAPISRAEMAVILHRVLMM